MAKKIYLSPSSQEANGYAYGNTNEEVQCRRISAACAVALKRCGFDVKDGNYGDMYTRVDDSNAWGADLHITIHTNAFNGEVTGTRIFCWNNYGDGYKASQAIFNELAPVTPGTSENVRPDPTLYEVEYSYAPCVYIEVDFHDVPNIAKWIIENVDVIGETIAKGICDYYGVKFVEEEKEPTVNTVAVSLPVLSNGSEGEAARAVMLVLCDKGYYPNALSNSDKLFGPKAEAALKKYQTANGLESDGVCGKATWSKLLS